jgi:chemotaxis protein methyltransferase CheR
MAFTFFFRDLQTLNTIVDTLVPFVSGKANIKIWDAGCASGQEPYSLAILLSEKMGRFAFKNVKIYATDLDISDQFGEIISTGIYTGQELQRIPADLLAKYFTPVDGTENFRVVDGLREKIIFRRESLLSLQPVTTEVSLVVCKNVLLHQQPDERVEIIRMFHRSLLPGGFLAMEQTQKMPDELSSYFEQSSGNTQVYQKKEL